MLSIVEVAEFVLTFIAMTILILRKVEVQVINF